MNLLNKFQVFFFRTNKLGELTLNQVGEKVCISGWLEFKRGGFFTLRDSTGSCQIVCNIEYQLPEKESIVNVEGMVRARPEKDRNPKMKTGDIEVVCSNRSEEHTSELQSHSDLVCRLLLEKKKKKIKKHLKHSLRIREIA